MLSMTQLTGDGLVIRDYVIWLAKIREFFNLLLAQNKEIYLFWSTGYKSITQWGRRKSSTIRRNIVTGLRGRPHGSRGGRANSSTPLSGFRCPPNERASADCFGKYFVHHWDNSHTVVLIVKKMKRDRCAGLGNFVRGPHWAFTVFVFAVQFHIKYANSELIMQNKLARCCPLLP